MSPRRAPPGLHASAAAVVLGLGLAAGLPALAQPRAPAPAPAAVAPGVRPLPGRLTQLRLVWSTMAAVDHANRTGNYSVLRDLGTAGFQAQNNPTALAGAFAGLRTHQVDVSETLVVQPTFEIAKMVEPDVLRLRGSFPLRPSAILFDLMFQWRDGWKLHGIAVVRA